jgi:invasion protein IalB
VSHQALVLRFCLAVLAAALFARAAPAQPEEQPQIVESLQDWILACVPASADKPARCELFQEITVRETGQRVFRLAFRLVEDGTVESSAIAPFGLNLRAGITFSVDGAELFVGEFLSCFATGCLSRFIVPSDILSKLEGGARLTAEMDIHEGETFSVNFSLPGLSDGLGRLRALAQQ